MCGIMLHMTTPVDEHTETWIPTDQTFGMRLAMVRRSMGWNLAEAARECGINRETWRLWEDEGKEPSRIVTVAMQIASRTRVDYLWLVHGPDRGGVQGAGSPTLRYHETPASAPVDRLAPRALERRRRSQDVVMTLPRPIRRSTPAAPPNRVTRSTERTTALSGAR